MSHDAHKIIKTKHLQKRLYKSEDHGKEPRRPRTVADVKPLREVFVEYLNHLVKQRDSGADPAPVCAIVIN